MKQVLQETIVFKKTAYSRFLMITERVVFKNQDGHDISGILRIPKEEGKHPAIILCHGFLSNKEHFLMSDLANGLSYYGFVTLRFDFTFHGESGGHAGILTLTQQVKDIRDAIDYLQKVPQVDTRKMILLGQDLGGVACLLADKKEIDGIVLVNVRTDLRAFLHSFITDYDLEEWLRTGWLDLKGVKLHKDFYKDLLKYDVKDAIKDEKVPILVVQSTNDKRVPVNDARGLLLIAKNAKIEEFEGADHNFDDPGHREQLVRVLVDWIQGILGT